MLDYLKLVVNLLVVLEHSFTCRPTDDGTNDYLFHVFTAFVQPFLMQSMAFCSGFVHEPVASVRKGRAVMQLFVGYFVVQVTYS